jgi:hypothetical protein
MTATKDSVIILAGIDAKGWKKKAYIIYPNGKRMLRVLSCFQKLSR